MDSHIKKQLLFIQQDEITGFHIYSNLSKRVKNTDNANLLQRIANNEMEHYTALKKYTGLDAKPLRFKIGLFTLMSHTLGLTFSLKLMEKGERKSEVFYQAIRNEIPEAEAIMRQEDEHEHELLGLINEEGLKYMSSVVLGLNDALVELTGALAGFTFAIQNSKLIALLGLITGISATLSMAASQFLSQRQDESREEALKSSVYTGIAYLGTVVLLIFPFLLFHNPFWNLTFTMSIALLIILVFNFYISVAKDLPFGKRFAEMAAISLSVATLSFGIGWLVKTYFGLNL